MKTPAAKPGAVRIVVQPLRARVVPALAPGRLSDAEAWQIAKAIRPSFAAYVEQYDSKKYWPVVYEQVRREFRQPKRVTTDTL